MKKAAIYKLRTIQKINIEKILIQLIWITNYTTMNYGVTLSFSSSRLEIVAFLLFLYPEIKFYSETK